MTRPVKWWLTLWAVLAAVVYSDLFDRRTHEAAVQFIASQRALRAQSAPLGTIEQGFRPLVRRSAVDSLPWPFLIFIGGSSATLVVARKVAS